MLDTCLCLQTAQLSLSRWLSALLGAVGSVIFLMRARGFEKVEAEGLTHARLTAVRRVVVIYAAIAWLCFLIAVALGDAAFIILTGIMAVLACAGLVWVYGRRASRTIRPRGSAVDRP
jgi:archaellum biogenesis protein FlaJ (TadC family)